MKNTFQLSDGQTITYYDLHAVPGIRLERLPYVVRVLVELLLRHQGRPGFEKSHLEALAQWTPDATGHAEFPFMPARVLFQDFTGVPCVVDLAALRDAMATRGCDPQRIEPRIPVDMVIDHSVQMDVCGTPDALNANMAREFERNAERYAFLRWGQSAFRKLNIVPPGVGICHQVNLEHLASCVMTEKNDRGELVAFPDTVVGTDSHTTMINGLGVLGWGVGGIEAEAAMLGQPIPLLTPNVTGVRLSGRLRPGVTATDLALTLTKILREAGVVGQLVEFTGSGLDHLSLADRAVMANMAPEYGATTGFFPIDAETLRYLKATGRSERQIELVECYCRTQGLWRAPNDPEPTYSRILELDLSTIEPCIAGPKRPHDRVALAHAGTAFRKALTDDPKQRGYGIGAAATNAAARLSSGETLRHGAVILASITSCTNTSNPDLILAAGLLARNAVARGLKVPSYVKTSLAPGSRAVTEYLRSSGLLTPLEQLGFHVAGYGCATCIGNSGPIASEIEDTIKEHKLIAAAVLSGNRNFEGRIHPAAKANYLCSPPLVVAYALAGSVNTDLTADPLGIDAQNQPVFLRDVWPTDDEIRALAERATTPAMYRAIYQDTRTSNPVWNAIQSPPSPTYAWNPRSTYIRNPSFVTDIPRTPTPPRDIVGAYALGFFGDFITTDHISPAGSIAKDSPAAAYLRTQGVDPMDFNSYGARRGNHEVMMRGTFANVRIRNRLVDREGGYTRRFPDGSEMSIYDAAQSYRADNIPLIVLAGKMYGAGSSRDWAAKGTYLLGVRAVIAESFERIHRSNLVEMGVLPLEFVDGQNADSLTLTGQEVFDVRGISQGLTPGQIWEVTATRADGTTTAFNVKSRVDSVIEADYLREGGILPFVLRMLAK